MINNQYKGRLAILYDRVLRYRKISKDERHPLEYPSQRARPQHEGHPDALCWHTEAFYNPKITKVEVTIEGVPSQLFSQGMRAYQTWDEAKKLFAASPGSKRHRNVSVVAKDLALADVSLGEFLTSKYSLWLDLRTTDDDRLHGNGRRIGEGVTIQITKTAEAAGALNIYLYIIMDAELDTEDGRLVQAAY